MELHVNDKVTIADLQHEFSKEFPFLKIEFFDIPHSKNNKLSRSHMYPADRAINSCRKTRNNGIIHITPEDTVAKLEKAFWDEYGLSAEVFRKSGPLWIETSLSDSWTLKLQNEEGRAFEPRPIDDELDLTDRDKWE